MNLEGIEVNEYGQTAAKVNGILFDCLSEEKVIAKGVVGKEVKYLLTPLPIVLAGKIPWGRFVVFLNSPISLLRRHLLQEMWDSAISSA